MGKKTIAALIGFTTALFTVGEADAGAIKHVFIVTMENTDAERIYQPSTSTDYIRTLLTDYAHATNFMDELPGMYSEPHYLWMEAGTNAFADHTFKKDSDPSRSNSTASGDHLVAQIKGDGKLNWMAYQEGAVAGVCPIGSSSGSKYAAKHNPFVFFQDVSGNPPSSSNAYCAAHTRPYSQFAQDLASGEVADYVFITPNLCDDMHGMPLVCGGDLVKAGDDWLKSELPRLISWAKERSGVIFVTWDQCQPCKTKRAPFIAIGSGVKPGYAGAVRYDHGSMLKSVEEILGLKILPKVEGANDLSDLFVPGSFP